MRKINVNTKMLFDAIRNCEDDPRPIVLEVRTRDGLFSKVLKGVGFDKNGIYLCAGDAADLPDKPKDPERRTVQPLPTSPYVGPNGKFYPV